MKNKILILLLTLTFSLQAKISIISDLDETIKQTHSHHAIGIYNALFTQKVYEDMPLILNELKRNKNFNKLHILSASPRAFKPNIKKLLNEHSINYDSLTVRNIAKDKNKFEYKYKFISKLMNETTDSYILIGDNLGDDPEAYLQIQSDFPGRVEAIYIHKVIESKIKENVEIYFSGYELALKELEKKHLASNFVYQLGEKILKTKNLKNYFPKRVYCPNTISDFDSLSSLKFPDLTDLITRNIIEFCN